MDAKLKKIEEDVMVLDDQNNKLNKVLYSVPAIINTQSNQYYVLKLYEREQPHLGQQVILFIGFSILGEETAGREDLRVHYQPG